jgi:2-phosphosulfolactate phosphatase
MNWHIIEGAAGCEFAVKNRCTAIIVDALRASATAAMLVDQGATSILVVREVEEALRAKQVLPGALLFGERGGVPPEGFDYGNSPQDAHHARDRGVIFTTTTGAGRLVSAWGAHAVLMGTTINATAVARAASGLEHDVVIIPAGFAGDPEFDAQEDWCAATAIAMKAGVTIGEGEEAFEAWRDRIDAEGIEAIFSGAPHAAKLRAIGMESDIAWCAQVDVTRAVPQGIARTELGVVLEGLEI